jgi:dTDP-4-dehydrorhamnose reductase
MKVLVLGGTGMLGGAVVREFSGFSGSILVSSRTGQIPGLDTSVEQLAFDAKADSVARALQSLERGDYVINCIGVIKSEIDESSELSMQNATQVNTTFPLQLAAEAEHRGIRVIQIATDCAFSGKTGEYLESSPHDALDHYGTTKSGGEVASGSMMHLRVSIIGPETRGHKSLFDWVALQPPGARITGFKNHVWNGIPARAFAQIARGIIETDIFVAGVHHVVPRDAVTKSQLVKLIAEHTGRSDLTIVEGLAPEDINRTLATNDKVFNAKLWAAAGRATVPSVADLVAEI